MSREERTEQRLTLIEVIKPVHDHDLIECLMVLDSETGEHVATARVTAPSQAGTHQVRRLARTQLLHALAERWGLTR